MKGAWMGNGERTTGGRTLTMEDMRVEGGGTRHVIFFATQFSCY
jgi:hypothetical protein